MYKLNHILLRELLEKELKILKLNDDSIKHVVNSLIDTSLRGVDSHGINLFPHYVNAIKNGRINKNPNFSYEKKTKAVAILNADGAIGHHSGAVAIEEAIKLAKKYGISAIGVKNSSHFGAAAYFSLMASQKNMLGFSFTNADALVKVTNAKESFFGTNPICFSAPMLDEEPLCLDMATSMISWNKKNNYQRENMLLEENWAYDIYGKTTLDPNKAKYLAPIGDYKGYGLGMMVDVLCAGLTNSIYSKDILPMYSSDITKRREISHFFMVIDINSFLDSKIFESTLQTIANRIRKLEKSGDKPVMIPGDPEKHTKKIRIKSGIPIDSEKFEEFLKINISFQRCVIE